MSYKLYYELGFESIERRRQYRKLCRFYKILKSQSPRYLFDVIPKAKSACITRNDDKVTHFKVKHNYLNFFPFGYDRMERTGSEDL